MSIRSGVVYGSCIFASLALLIACSARTRFHRAPLPEQFSTPPGAATKVWKQSCIDATRACRYIASPDFHPRIKSADPKKLCSALTKAADNELVKCTDADVWLGWNEFASKVEEENRGLFSGPPPAAQLTRQPDRDFTGNAAPSSSADPAAGAAAPVDNREMSISTARPASFAISVRPLKEQPDTTSFAGLSPQVQRALIEYAAKLAKPSEAEAAPALLASLNSKDEGSFSASQQIEVTISNALNSASERDRLEYVTAYIDIIPLGGTTNADVSLDQELVNRFQEYSAARSPNDAGNEQLIQQDFESAIEDMKVQFTAVQGLATVTAVAQPNGTITAGLSGTGAISSTSMAPAQASGSVTASAQRTESLASEIDRRSMFISRGRALLRITERGIQNANISGSISSAVSLKVPTTPLTAITVSEQTAKEPAEVGLKDISEPIFRTVEAVWAVIGSVRVSEPGWFDWFRSEPSGVVVTSVESPQRITLWKNPRELASLTVGDLVKPLGDEQQQAIVGQQKVGIHRLDNWPIPDSEADMLEGDAELLSKLLRTHKVGLKKNLGLSNMPDTFWIETETCEKSVSLNPQFVLGVYDDTGVIPKVRPFEAKHVSFTGELTCARDRHAK